MEKDDVIFLKGAEISIFQIYSYIVLLGYPETSENFIERLYSFGYSIAHFPNKYPICRFKKFAKRKLHCAIFENSYIFIYKIINHKVVIYNVIHTKTLK